MANDMIMSLTAGEWCLIQRRRDQRTLPQVAKLMGVSRQTIWAWEHDTGSTHKLVHFWKGRQRQ